MQSFWAQLPKPFFVQAPMEDVTDAAFRALIARFGAPHVMFSEFTSADGLVLAPESGQKVLRRKLRYSPEERPIVAQLFSAVPERMERAAAITAELGFDGIDINMGCPAREVVATGCGAGLIQTPPLAQEVIRAAQRGAHGLPISVKTRIGYNVDETETWVPALLSTGIAALTIHARTRDEMSDVPARWDRVKRAVEIRDALGAETVILGNGDVRDVAHGRELAKETGCDGVMLGRAIYGNPWLYAGPTAPPTPEERIEALAEHIRLFQELIADTLNFAVMKKHFKAYISGWDNAKELRVRLMETTTAEEALEILRDVV
jgi:nifR3 family TIM-barrel protein